MEQKKLSIKNVIAITATALMFLSLDATNNPSEAVDKSKTFQCPLTDGNGSVKIWADATVNYNVEGGLVRINKVFMNTRQGFGGQNTGTIGHKSSFQARFCGQFGDTWLRPFGTMDATKTVFGRGRKVCRLPEAKFNYTADINIAGTGSIKCAGGGSLE